MSPPQQNTAAELQGFQRYTMFYHTGEVDITDLQRCKVKVYLIKQCIKVVEKFIQLNTPTSVYCRS